MSEYNVCICECIRKNKPVQHTCFVVGVVWNSADYAWRSEVTKGSDRFRSNFPDFRPTLHEEFGRSNPGIACMGSVRRAEKSNK